MWSSALAWAVTLACPSRSMSARGPRVESSKSKRPEWVEESLPTE